MGSVREPIGSNGGVVEEEWVGSEWWAAGGVGKIARTSLAETT